MKGNVKKKKSLLFPLQIFPRYFYNEILFSFGLFCSPFYAREGQKTLNSNQETKNLYPPSPNYNTTIVIDRCSHCLRLSYFSCTVAYTYFILIPYSLILYSPISYYRISKLWLIYLQLYLFTVFLSPSSSSIGNRNILLH